MIPSTERPLHVAYDIARLSAGGTNGGIKVHHYEFLRQFVNKHSDELRLHVFCQEELIEELSFLSAQGAHQIHVIGPRVSFEPRNSDGSLPILRYWPDIPTNLLTLLEIDILYAGFGFSQLYTPKVPQVSLIVDVLHRCFPATLPTAETQFRDRWYKEAVQRSTLVQTNSEPCKEQLVSEFKFDPQNVFTLSLPLHGRFNSVEMGSLPSKIAHLPHKYFLYPANYWAHKNHKRLVEAYALYKRQAGNEALHLVLTGHSDGRSEQLSQQISEAGLADYVHQVDHADLPTFKAIWELAHSLVFPSQYEGFGLPLLEAHFFQKPVLCSDSSTGPKELAPHSLKVDVTQTSEFAEALAALQNNPSQYLDDGSTLEKFDALDEVYNLLCHWKKASNRSRKADAIDA